jgi:hypothetical protein
MLEGVELPLAPSCSLDADGLRRQRERYRRIGGGARVLERTARRIAVQVPASGAEVVPELIEVESECCPFFGLDWEPAERRFSVSVPSERDEPALEAIAFALGL